jgi:hypothetical protein
MVVTSDPHVGVTLIANYGLVRMEGGLIAGSMPEPSQTPFIEAAVQGRANSSVSIAVVATEEFELIPAASPDVHPGSEVVKAFEDMGWKVDGAEFQDDSTVLPYIVASAKLTIGPSGHAAWELLGKLAERLSSRSGPRTAAQLPSMYVAGGTLGARVTFFQSGPPGSWYTPEKFMATATVGPILAKYRLDWATPPLDRADDLAWSGEGLFPRYVITDLDNEANLALPLLISATLAGLIGPVFAKGISELLPLSGSSRRNSGAVRGVRKPDTTVVRRPAKSGRVRQQKKRKRRRH